MDDCSVPDDSDLFDPTPAGVARYGPLKSYRCNAFGHRCNIGGTLQQPPLTTPMANLQGCVSDETASGKLTKIAEEVAFLKSLKADPNQIFVAAITGPSSPYTLVPDVDGDLSVAHSCTAAAGQYADPSIRVQQWVEGFGNHGLLQTICANSFAPALMSIATEVGKALGPSCIDNHLRDIDLATPGLQPDCQAFDQYLDDQGHLVRSELPACAADGNTPPCWALLADPGRCWDNRCSST